MGIAANEDLSAEFDSEPALALTMVLDFSPA
jgi:hypothetical protein